MSANRELVIFYITYKLSQRNFFLNNMGLSEASEKTEGGQQLRVSHANASPLRLQRSAPTASLDEVKEALRDSANEFERLYSRTFRDLHNEQYITAATAYQSFANVMDEVFRSGINWGRVVVLFAFGGALCVECVEKDMSELVDRIAEWMTVYLDNHIQPWIKSHGGWERFAELYAHDAAAESRRSQERFAKWMLAGVTLVTVAVLGSLLAQKKL